LGGLNIFNIFQGDDASQKFFDIRRAFIEEGFKVGEGNFKLGAIFGGGKFAGEGPPADSALILADALGGFNSTENVWYSAGSNNTGKKG